MQEGSPYTGTLTAFYEPNIRCCFKKDAISWNGMVGANECIEHRTRAYYQYLAQLNDSWMDTGLMTTNASYTVLITLKNDV